MVSERYGLSRFRNQHIAKSHWLGSCRIHTRRAIDPTKKRDDARRDNKEEEYTMFDWLFELFRPRKGDEPTSRAQGYLWGD